MHLFHGWASTLKMGIFNYKNVKKLLLLLFKTVKLHTLVWFVLSKEFLHGVIIDGITRSVHGKVNCSTVIFLKTQHGILSI